MPIVIIIVVVVVVVDDDVIVIVIIIDLNDESRSLPPDRLNYCLSAMIAT